MTVFYFLQKVATTAYAKDQDAQLKKLMSVIIVMVRTRFPTRCNSWYLATKQQTRDVTRTILLSRRLVAPSWCCWTLQARPMLFIALNGQMQAMSHDCDSSFWTARLGVWPGNEDTKRSSRSSAETAAREKLLAVRVAHVPR